MNEVTQFMETLKTNEKNTFIEMIDNDIQVEDAYDYCFDSKRDHNIHAGLIEKDFGKVSDNIDNKCKLCPAQKMCNNASLKVMFADETITCSDTIEMYTIAVDNGIKEELENDH